MDVQVEVQFTIQHTLDELKNEFVKRGHIPAWRSITDTDLRPDLFFESRVVSVNLSGEEERLAWFIFSMEACGELRNRVVIPNVVPSGVRVDYPTLDDFLAFCRHCLVASPAND
ncbi:MAG: hypothetical protein H6Q00_217 [Holophagaceae bacterium]|nr:hypothetical protein [Holophagaceae bacterium]